MSDYLKKVSIICSCYKGGKYLEAFFENVEQQTIFSQIELIIDHNEPSTKELELVSDFRKRHPDSIIHRIVRPVISTPASFNRCIRSARSEYLTTWSVDDHRVPDALQRMCETLDRNPKVGFTYGDFLEVKGLRKRNGKIVRTPEFDPILFKEGMPAGPFLFWRSNLTQKVGFWDEQLFSGSDYDFLVRLAFQSVGKKTPGLLGFFLKIGEGSSGGAKHLEEDIQQKDRTVIELRYCCYHKTISNNGFRYVRNTKRYRLDHLLIDGQWHSLERYVPDYREIMKIRLREKLEFDKKYRRWLLMYCFPEAGFRLLRNNAKLLLKKLHLLESAKKLFEK